MVDLQYFTTNLDIDEDLRIDHTRPMALDEFVGMGGIEATSRVSLSSFERAGSEQDCTSGM